MVASMNQHLSNKRPRPDSPQSVHIPQNNYQNSEPALSSAPSATSHAQGSAASSFRNVSACNRCRLRKNRCDQNLPSCASCEKAKVRCVGFDPITKREIPRAYVYYLESRVSYLEDLLNSRGIAFAPAEDFEVGTSKQNNNGNGFNPTSSPPQVERQPPSARKRPSSDTTRKQEEAEKLNKLVSNIGMVSVQGASDPRYLGSTSGISFARVVFAAVRSSISGSTSDKAGIRPGKIYGAAAVNGASMRDSFFGLQSKPAYKKAPFPDRELGERLVNLYFEMANPQIPILHRGEFMALFDRAYASEDRRRSPRESYMLNIVFAIGAGIIFGGPSPNGSTASNESEIKQEPKGSSKQHQAEEYHASAMVHLEYFLSSTPAVDRPEGFGGSLEELQAVLLLASFALLRPVAPGLWYIVGVAVRLGVDLGLHYEDGTGIEDSMGGTVIPRSQEIAIQAAGARPSLVDPREKGRREWVRDFRRRLWWCVYSLDRLVSTCVGRPFGITDQVITTEFPSILDDNYITTSGFAAPPGTEHEPSYKRVAHHYFRLRLLQSEILQVLQHRQARQARARGKNANNRWMHTKMSSPFLQRFEGSFYAWRADIDKRLWEWKQSCPTQKEIAVSFNILLLELNYWQAVIMLYRQSLSVPQELGDPSPADDVTSPIDVRLEEENEDEVFMKVATAGQKVLKLYYQLHRAHIVNYTFLATHNLFMAGIAFLYAIWHSTTVRNLLSIDDVDYTVLAATTVLQSLAEKCPPAETCRDAFERMAKATVSMVLKSTGFGNRPPLLGVPKAKRPRSSSPHSRNTSTNSDPGMMRPQTPPHSTMQHQPPFYQNEYSQYRNVNSRFQFDMNLRELFPDDTPESQRFRTVKWGVGQHQPRSQADLPQQQNMQYSTPAHSPASPSPSYHSPSAIPAQPATPQPHQMQHQPPSSSQPPALQHQVSSSQPPSLQHQISSSESPALQHQVSSQAPGTPQSYNSYPMDPTPQSMPQQNPNTIPFSGGPVMPPPEAAAAAMAGTPPPPGYETIGFQDDLNFLLASDTSGNGAYMSNSGISLGFDTDHDWNDGTGPDLFDGFWFRSGWGSMSGEGGIAALAVNGGQSGMVPGQAMASMGAMGPVGAQGQQEWDGVKMEQ